MSGRQLFITGGSGFIGRALVPRLVAQGTTCTVLTRTPQHTPVDGTTCSIRGSLADVNRYRTALHEDSTVVHLAGVTGVSTPTDYLKGNLEGTRALIAACRERGVRRLIFVSTIAVGFAHLNHYAYARSKRLAEQEVQTSGLGYVIVRPTIVMGGGSPIWNALRRVATSPVPIIPGNGRTRVQPVWIEDTIDTLIELIRRPLFDVTVELGGPDVVTFDDWLHRMRLACGYRPTRIWHAPVWPALPLLSWLDRHVPVSLPMSPGQLCPFVDDGTARDDLWPSEVPRPRTTIDQMLRQLLRNDRD